MDVEGLRRAGWALLVGAIVLAWLTAAFAVDVAASGIVAPPPQRLLDLATSLRAMDRYLAMAGGVGFLVVFLSWRRAGRNVPPWLRRLLPWRLPDLTKDMLIFVGVTVAWGWSCVAAGSLLRGTSPALATAVVMVLHAPLSLLTAPLIVIVTLMPMLVAVALPLPVVLQLTLYWAVLGALLHMVLTSYGWSGRYLPRGRRPTGRWT